LGQERGERGRGREKKKVIKGRKEIVIAVTNKELHFDWIIYSPYDRHSTVSFHGLIDVINKYREQKYSNLNQYYNRYIN
jgi:hypothetical protein